MLQFYLGVFSVAVGLLSLAFLLLFVVVAPIELMCQAFARIQRFIKELRNVQEKEGND